jgi:hypothetical protein
MFSGGLLLSPLGYFEHKDFLSSVNLRHENFPKVSLLTASETTDRISFSERGNGRNVAVSAAIKVLRASLMPFIIYRYQQSAMHQEVPAGGSTVPKLHHCTMTNAALSNLMTRETPQEYIPRDGRWLQLWVNA